MKGAQDMKVFDEIRDMLCDELEEIAKKKELTSSSLEIIGDAVDIVKDISTIKAMEQEYPTVGYSRDGYSNGSYGRPVYMNDGDVGNSYARGRIGDVKRDSMGRYSNEGYSRNDGYSGDTKEELHRLMDAAQNDKEREAIRKALDSMR